MKQLTLGPYVGQIWSRNTLNLRGNETVVAHRVVREGGRERARGERTRRGTGYGFGVLGMGFVV